MSMAMKFFILYLILFVYSPLGRVVLLLRRKAGVLNVYGCFIAQCFCGVVLTPALGQVRLRRLFDLFRRSV